MIEVFVAVMAMFGIGTGDDPAKVTMQNDDQQIIRAIDSQELSGYNNLEALNADEWFV